MASGATIKQKRPGALDNLRKTLEEVGRMEVAVGYPAGKAQAYPDGESVASVAAQHVYGIGVPQRDFMSYAKRNIPRATGKYLAQLSKEVSRSAVDVSGFTNAISRARAMQTAAGMVAVTEIQRAIQDGPWEPNSPVTVALKGSSQPLIDTTHMKNSTTFVVRKRTRK